MLKRIDHVGVIVDDLADAERLLGEGFGMTRTRGVELPNRLKAAFYRCGEVEIEVIEVTDPSERAQRLGGEQAKVEHIAVEVDDLATALKALEALGVRPNAQPAKVGPNTSVWTIPETSDGYQFQFFEREK